MTENSPHNHHVTFDKHEETPLPQANGVQDFDEQENALPAGPEKVVRTASSVEERREGTRSKIAFILGALLAGLFFSVAIVYILDLTDTADRMDQLMSTVVTSATTVFASVIGYYFGSERK